jgi:DedD protein
VTFQSPVAPELKVAGAKKESLEVIRPANPITPRESTESTAGVVPVAPELKQEPAVEQFTEPAKSSVTNEAIQSPEKKAVVPVVDESLPQSIGQAWVVQLGTFGSKDNALLLRDKARAQGYSTHTSELVKSGKTLTRVYAGPFINRADADKVKDLLDKKFTVKSMVVKFSE